MTKLDVNATTLEQQTHSFSMVFNEAQNSSAATNRSQSYNSENTLSSQSTASESTHNSANLQ